MSEINRLDGNSAPKARPGIKIVGANEISNPTPQVLDRTIKQEQEPIDVRVHEEVITEDDRLRRKADDDGISVRIRTQNRPLWEKIKRLEDDE